MGDMHRRPSMSPSLMSHRPSLRNTASVGRRQALTTTTAVVLTLFAQEVHANTFDRFGANKNDEAILYGRFEAIKGASASVADLARMLGDEEWDQMRQFARNFASIVLQGQMQP